MPFIERQRQRIFYEDTGSGPALVLGHSFLCSGEMWEHQVPVLAESFRVVNIDYRGHGKSSTVERDFTLYDLVDDTIAILDRLDIGQAIWGGLSAGGMTALRASLTVPEKVRAIFVADASAAAEPPYTKLKYRALGLGARLVGMRPFVPAVVPIMFGKTTMKETRDLIDEWIPSFLSLELPSLLRFLEALVTRDSLLDQLSEVEIPSLILVGEEDRAQPVFRARQMADGIPGARLEIIPKAGHLSALEQPQAFNRALVSFLDTLGD